MSTSLNKEYLEVINHLNPDWLIYATPEESFFDQRNFSKIRDKMCVGLRIPHGENETEILFKHILKSSAGASKLKKVFERAKELNECEHPMPTDDLCYFLTKEALAVESSPSPQNYIELKNDLKNE